MLGCWKWNSFHPALKYTWEISENSLAFLDIKLSINDNGLSTSVHCKPTDSHNYLLHSSSHPQHLKNAIPFSQFLRLRRLCSDDTDFNNKGEEMCQFFKKRGYPDSAVTTGKHGAQEIDRETALQTSQNEETDRIPFTLTYHPQNLAIKNFKFSAMIPKLNTYFLYHHSFHSNATKTLAISYSGAYSSLTTNQEPSHANAYDAKLVPLFLTQLRSQDPINPSKSQTISPASLQMSSIA